MAASTGAVGASLGESAADGTGGNGSGVSGGYGVRTGRAPVRVFSGRGREQLRHLHDTQMEILACLRGIGRLSGGGGGKTAQIAVPEELAAKALERRYHCARRAVTEYTARTVDGDFGIVFQHLADLSREECVLLARLLGEQAQNISRS